tara:strand:- start:2616 stop:3593 length:978 start_codon:yes stop_codon:yes gene_type:complete
MTERVLVTGAAGFIGYALARHLVDSGAEVVGVDDFSRGARDQGFEALAASEGFEFVEVDLASSNVSDRLPAGPFDMILHMAALNGTQNFYERPYAVLRASTLPTFSLVERYVVGGQVGRFVYAGSSESYASTVSRFGWSVPTAEDVPLSIADPTNPRWSYGVSKLHGEVLTASACAQYGVDYSVIRYHNVYGPRMGDKHVIPDFAMRMKEERYELFGHEDTRSFLYIDDAVAATLALARAPGARNQIVNVGSDREVTIRELGDMMMRARDLSNDVELHPSPQGSVKRRAPDLTKLRSLIDFRPAVPLEEGVRRTVDWYLDGQDRG